MNGHADPIDRIDKRLEALEQRVHALEHPVDVSPPHPSPKTVAIAQGPAGANSLTTPSAGIFPLLGRAMLGIAGAYLLRAMTESGVLPQLAIAAIGIAYAFLWLAWAARTRGPRLVSIVYACTSVLILAPMLWELTLRFNVLSAPVAAAVLCGFALAAVALALRPDLFPVLSIALMAAAGLSLALAIASRALLPFIVMLLILAALCEFMPALNRITWMRALVALAADAAIWMMIYIYFTPQSAREDYPMLARTTVLAPGIAVFLLYGAGVCWKTLVSGKPITALATVQTSIAFLLAAVSFCDFGPRSGTVILGIVCLALSFAGYAAVFTVFERAPERRNAAVFSVWTAFLLLAGSFLCLPSPAIVAVFGAAAIAFTLVGSRKSRLAFEFYGMVFLLAAAMASDLLSFILNALVLAPSGAPGMGVWLIAGCTILCCAAAMQRASENGAAQALHLAFAALAVGATAALVVHGLTGLAALFVEPGAHHLAFIRTLTLCAAAISFAFGGARLPRVELTRLGYVALALVAVKLLFEDLRQGHLTFIAASIFLFALTLIAVPRVARVGKTHDSTAPLSPTLP